MMSSKRRVDSPATPQSKRRKRSQGQSRLDSFFSSPSKAKQPSPKKTEDPEIINVDELDDDEPSADRSGAALASPSLSESHRTASVLHPVKFIQTGEVGSVEPSAPQFSSLAIDPVFYNPHSQSALIAFSSDIPYSFLAHTLFTISGTRSRIAILDTLTNSFRTILAHYPQSLLPSLYLLSNTLSPAYSSALELNVGPSVISQAIQQVSGLSSASLKSLYKSSGDPGDVAFAAKVNTRTLFPHPPLLVISVYQSLRNIALCKGQGATKSKQKIIEKLLISARGEEIRFLVRTLAQNLRVGAVRTSLLTALARSFVLAPPLAHKGSSLCISEGFLTSIQPTASGSKKKKSSQSSSEIARAELLSKFRSAEQLLRKTFAQHPDYDHIVNALLQGGLDELAKRVPLTVGVPVYPALGSPIRSFNEIFERWNERPFSAELKYDGQRAQIHASRQADGRVDVRMFSRHQEDMTSKFPDVTGLFELLFKDHEDIQSLIIDSEIVAIDSATGALKSFQLLQSRKNTTDLGKIEIPVAVFAFDLLYLDGKILLEDSFRTRRSLLRSQFPVFIPKNELLARFQHVESCDSEDGQTQLQEFWEKSVVTTEGIMVKLLDEEAYSPEKRNWFKLKKDYVSGLGDSLDMIVMGAWHGSGRKYQWWSPILLGVWDPEKGRPVAVCKCMSGFTDTFYKALSNRYSLQDENDCSNNRRWEGEFGGFRPDVYFRPHEVWEIRGADVTLSPVSLAAQNLTSSSRGLSLRFPRFIRVRDDKSIAQASDATFLANIWRNQGKSKDDQEDELIDVDMDSVEEYSELDNDVI